MPVVNFLLPDGERLAIEAVAGETLMETATAADVPGIIGECGGCCSCATCHVQVDPAWYARLDPPDGMEQAMLEGAIEPVPTSRLGCQIELSDALDGLTVRVPEGQL